ncbi:MAG: PHP domain-containing protein [Candidatus Aminicenantes bacterium]|nr:PHP domain-containing protein [Candidatus Aminicenantes bacterium]
MRSNLKILGLFLLFGFLFSFSNSSAQVKIIQTGSDIPGDFCTVWEPGDYILNDGYYLAVIGASSRTLRLSYGNYPTDNALGTILSLIPAGKKSLSNLNIGLPNLRLGDERKYIFYSAINHTKKIESEGIDEFTAKSLYSEASGEQAEIITKYAFLPGQGRVDITSTIVNTGTVELEDMEYSLINNVNHHYNFSPFHVERYPRLNYRIYPKIDYFIAAIDRNSINPDHETRPGKLGLGQSYSVEYSLLVDDDMTGLLNRIHKDLKLHTETVEIRLEERTGDWVELTIREIASGAMFFRNFLKNTDSISLPLPAGIYTVSANFFPAVQTAILEVGSGGKNSCTLTDAPLAKVKVKIKDKKGAFFPGKVTFIGLDPTITPYFMPDNPVETGKIWESFKNSLFPGPEGIQALVPAGTYLVFASRGPEYSIDQRVVELFKDQHQDFLFEIEKVVETGDLISLDPHMHTNNSDGRMGIPERIRSVAAEGIEVAVSTDHNFISDYLPDLMQLELDTWLHVIYGNEVTTGELLHYNTYPIRIRKEEPANGAINAFPDSVKRLFSSSRGKDPGAIIQVNHPRAGTIGYFNNYQLDPEKAAFAKETMDLTFDVLEVMNGPQYSGGNMAAVKDWLNLINRGHYYPIVGSSDSHGIDRSEPGYSRTYVLFGEKKGQTFDEDKLIQAVKSGKSFASNGPLIEFVVNDTFSFGETLTDSDGEVDIRIKVWSAPWVSVDQISLIVNGKRKMGFPSHRDPSGVVKFYKEFPLKLSQDSALIVEAVGSGSLFPVMQRSSRSGLREDACTPYAISNPVFVDFDGNSKFDPPEPEKIKLMKEPPATKTVSR